MQNQASLFLPPDVRLVPEWRIFLQNVIIDRWSKYSALLQDLPPSSDPQKSAKLFFHELKNNKFHAKATHNSYARRCERDDGFVAEWYFDDGEKGAGKIILREMQKTHLLNGIIVVVRYYWGIKLEGDRFRHVVDASQMIIEQIL